MVHSYDIFDTCLVRKCGTPINFFDVLSLRVFNNQPTESERQEFIFFRLEAEGCVNADGVSTLELIYKSFNYNNPKLKGRDELYLTELECERQMLVPSIRIKDEVDQIHIEGNNVIFISDMYLPASFLRERLIQFGFYKDGDKIYVSGDVGKTKASGSLFNYIREKENIEYKDWIHHGDNSSTDIEIPKKLGIKTCRVNHNYTYFQHAWRKYDFSLQYKAKSIVAGLSRAVLQSNEKNDHSAFVTDIICPFYSSWTFRILKDAKNKGIRRLYFCSRDCYQQFQIAHIIQERLFPEIECKYVYLSRQSIAQSDDASKLQYFVQEGLACNESVAIVDTRSQGRTQYLLNNLFTSNGYNPIAAYYFIVFPCNEIKYKIEYVSEINRTYAIGNCNLYSLLIPELEGPIYEIFFSMNNAPRTIGYTMKGNVSVPLFDNNNDNDGYWTINSTFYMNLYKKLLFDFITGYIDTGLYKYSDVVFENIAVVTLNDFFKNPTKEYLMALVDFRCCINGKDIPFVINSSIFQFVKTRGRNCVWKEGSLAYMLPSRLVHLNKKYHIVSRASSSKHLIKRAIKKMYKIIIIS